MDLAGHLYHLIREKNRHILPVYYLTDNVSKNVRNAHLFCEERNDF